MTLPERKLFTVQARCKHGSIFSSRCKHGASMEVSSQSHSTSHTLLNHQQPHLILSHRVLSASKSCRYDPSRKAYDPQKVLTAVPPSCTTPLGSLQNPKRPDRKNPTAPTRFQNPTCQPMRWGCGRYHFGCSSNMNSSALTMKKVAPIACVNQYRPSQILKLPESSGGYTPGVPKMQGICKRQQQTHRTALHGCPDTQQAHDGATQNPCQVICTWL
jgi:hypothetical protein